MAHMFVPEAQGMEMLQRPKKSRRLLTLLLPHVALTTLLFCYIASGAAIFQAIELPEEYREMRHKLMSIKTVYGDISDSTWNYCVQKPMLFTPTYNDFWAYLTNELNKLTSAHQRLYAPINATDIVSPVKEPVNSQPRWSYPAAVLYALGVLTTTGYSYVQLSTTSGKVFAVCYGLVGFPLMFLTAADIGKLMSELVSFAYFTWLDRRSHRQGRRISTMSSSESGTNGESGGTTNEATVELPAWAIFGATLVICVLGSFMYMQVEMWSFVDALYFAFNAVTNVTLGDIPVSGMTFAAVTVLFVTLGLAVVTMSIDLAQNQLRSLFRKIHYFGRTIKNLKGRFMLELDEDVKELLKVIAAIRRRHPHKSKVTQDDIFIYLQEEMSPKHSLRAFRRSKKHRKSTAFIPVGIGAIKFADEEKSGVCTPPNSSMEDLYSSSERLPAITINITTNPGYGSFDTCEIDNIAIS